MAVFKKIQKILPVFFILLGSMVSDSSTTSLSSQSFGGLPETGLKPALYYVFPETEIEKFQEIFPYIVAKSREYSVSLAFVLAIIKSESNFTQNAVSRAGALGLMQLMPNTAKAQYQKVVYGAQVNDLKKNLILNPELNVTLGIRYLRQLQNTLSGIKNPDQRRKIVLAAYNAGLRRVKKSFRCGKNLTLIKLINKNGMGYFNRSIKRLPRETQKYITKVNKNFQLYTEY